jgi:hypothetical protein
MGVVAEFERAMIQERVRAGLARARSEGKRLGRPADSPRAGRAYQEGSGDSWQAGRASPSSLGLIQVQCSGSAALSRQAQPPCEKD